MHEEKRFAFSSSTNSKYENILMAYICAGIETGMQDK
jgi:hypothetical protein